MMVKFINKLFIVMVMLIFAPLIRAQISEGGVPPSFVYSLKDPSLKADMEITPYRIKNPFSLSQLMEDEAISGNGLPERVGILLAAGLSLSDAGEWTKLSTGEMICRLRVQSQGAIAISLYYKRFYIPEGGRLFIYNKSHTQLLGAYTSRTNPDGGLFSSEFVAGDDIILEYAAPEINNEAPQIEISDICYGYKNLRVLNGVDISCMVDINCPEGNDWKNEKDGVVKMITVIGRYSYLCTATLLNNTSEDFKPYMYTAFHCLKDDYKFVSTTELLQSQFYFNYETTSCMGDMIRDYTSIIGCEFLEGSDLNGGLDQALLLMKGRIPSGLNPYFNGWDRGVEASESGVCIHHPQGSVKKISTFTSPAVSYTWRSPGVTGFNDGHWSVHFVRTSNGFSVTEKGSSGSSLFNQEHNVVGSLTGGSSSCSNLNGINCYGKLHLFFDNVSKYLDPLGKGWGKLNGCHMLNVRPAPRNLSARWSNDRTEVTLTWEAPDKIPLSYVIYRNDLEVGRGSALSFTESGLYAGLHEYQVVALYENDEKSAKSAAVMVEKHIIAPPRNISATRVGEQDVEVKWNLPIAEQQIFWGSGKSGNWGGYSGNVFPFYFGQQWSPSDLKCVDRCTITKVKFFEHANVNYAIYIEQGDRIYTEEVERSDKNRDIEKLLSVPFVVDASQKLICAVKVLKADNKYYLTTDAAPALPNRGNIFSIDGKKWNALTSNNFYLKFSLSSVMGEEKFAARGDVQTEIVSAEEEHNFIFSTVNSLKSDVVSEGAIVASSRPVGFMAPCYDVYRNGGLFSLGAVEKSVKDIGVEKGKSYIYKVSARYGDEGEDFSESAPFFLKPESFDANIKSLVVNGVEASLVSGELRYNIALDCDVSKATIFVSTLHSGAVVKINDKIGRTYTEDVDAGKHVVPVEVISESGENAKSYALGIYKLPDNIILKRWDDVLVVANNPEINGGFRFSSYKWYRNGVVLDALSQYITLPANKSSADVYMVELVTEDGVIVKSCGQKFDLGATRIQLYPTSVKGGDVVTLYIDQDCGLPERATVVISDMGGRINTVPVTGRCSKIIVPSVVGTYIVKVFASDGTVGEFKIRVIK
ncbi:MAG: hypothetical protein RR341_01670 [Bacteroidales bacterium]